MKDFPFFRALRNAEAPWRVLFRCAVTVFIIYFEFKVAMPAFALGGGHAMFGLATTMILGLVLSILWRNAIIDFICSPLTNLFTGGSEVAEKKPLYSAALARRNRGQYDEAMAEVRQQLNQFPQDFDGVMLLAGIQAENLKDMPAAQHTLTQFSDRPETPQEMAAVALTQLADWHLRLAADEEMARAVWQKIIARFPGTGTALLAEQRLTHLGERMKMIRAQQDRPTVIVPPGVRHLGLLDATEFLKPLDRGSICLASEYVRHLEAHPHDSELREKLATVYARDLKRLDLAALELEQLINEPNHKPKQVAHWLNLLANFQVELGADPAAVRATLENIVERFPDLPVAEMAQRRQALLNHEFRGRQETPVVRLGAYEQNIGLKYGAPGRN